MNVDFSQLLQIKNKNRKKTTHGIRHDSREKKMSNFYQVTFKGGQCPWKPGSFPRTYGHLYSLDTRVLSKQQVGIGV